MTEIFHYATGDDGIATITWDLPGASMNVLDEQGIRLLQRSEWTDAQRAWVKRFFTNEVLPVVTPTESSE